MMADTMVVQWGGGEMGVMGVVGVVGVDVMAT